MNQIPVSVPVLGALERKYVAEAMAEGAISGFFGRFIPLFETEFAKFCGSRHGVAVSSGTGAIHVALAALGIRAGDEVLVSTLTNMATFFAVLYQGAVPVPVDIEPDTLNMDPRLLEGLVTPKTKAILVVHLYGHPVDMGPVLKVAHRHRLAVVEDCAEAHGAEYKGRRVGSLGTVGCFSFYANKVITTGEGGMCTTDSRPLAEKMQSLKSLAFGKADKFMHAALGYNYRMTNVQAAIGCGQLSRIGETIAAKREVAARYTSLLSGIDELTLPVEKDYAKNVFWMYHVMVSGKAAGRRKSVMARLAERGIETREGFVPFNMQKVFLDQGIVRRDACPVANGVARRGFYLPSGAGLSPGEIRRVVRELKDILKNP